MISVINKLNEYESPREVKILIKISKSLISTLDYQKVIQIISDGMSELLNIDSAAIYFIKGKNKLFLSATTPPLNIEFPDELRKAKLEDHPHILTTVKTKKAQIIEDTKKAVLSNAEKLVTETRKLKSILYLPLHIEKKVQGVLILGTYNSRKFSENEIEFSQAVANHLAVSVQNTALHSELLNQKKKLEETVIAKNKKLDIAISKLKTKNDELSDKNKVIEKQNKELLGTIDNLNKTQRQLIESEKMASLGTLTAGIAHEINNPLNFLSASSIALQKIYEDEPVKNNDILFMLKSIKTGINRISGIVKGLNQFSRSNENMNEDCDIHSIIDNTIFILKNKIKNKIEINKLFCDSNFILKGNSGMLHQAILNILSNSIDAIKNNGEISISTETNTITKTLKIVIKDTGSGINKEDINKITEPFFTTKKPGEGVGLGLSITYNVLKKHKAKMVFESEKEKGTTVTIILPVKF